MGFFDEYPRFYQTSKTTPFPDRLNGRYEACIAANADQIRGKRVLDIASHDGRWSLAALTAGAAHVTGVEARSDLVDSSRATLQEYGINPARYDFHVADIFEYLRRQSFDVVLCLGFFYHTIRHVELFHLMSSTNPGLIVIDTEVTPRGEERPEVESSDSRLIHQNPYVIQLLPDPSNMEQMAWQDPTTRDGMTLVGRPSRAAVKLIARHFGYEGSPYDWTSYFQRNPAHAGSMPDYQAGWRETFSLHRR